MEVHFENFSFLAGGRCPPDPPVFGWGGKAPLDPPLNGRSSHLMEAAKRGRLDQMKFFSVPLTTRAPSTTVRPDVRPNAWPNLRPNASLNARPNVRPNFWVFGFSGL